MPTDSPMTTKPTRRPWWVAPGVCALLGAGIIAVAAQGSLAGGRVALPAGPRLSPETVAAAPVATTTPVPTATVVTPVRPVVTQTAAAGGSAWSSGSGGSSTGSGSDGTGWRPGPATDGTPEPAPDGAGASGGGGGTTETTEAVPTTTVPRPPPTTTTTTTEPERKDK